jgi:hypothetical protein
VLRETVKDLKEAFINDLSEDLFEKIFIVFEDLYDTELHRDVSHLCRDNRIKFDLIATKEQAIKMRTEYKSLEAGVFFIKKELGRGLDPKFKADAYVCAIESGGDLDDLNRVESDFTESDVLQFMGRSSRSQGQAKGCFYMIGDSTGNIDGWDIIKARTTVRKDDGGKTLKMFFDALKTMNLKEFLGIELHWSTVNRENWRKNPTEWIRDYKHTYEFYIKK